MALQVDIDFDRTYPILEVTNDLTECIFETLTKDQNTIPLKVSISNQAHALLPDVYNLAFGPLDKNGRIDDKVQIEHSDYSKVFSTILFSALTYMEANPERYLGVDGSNQARAMMYYRFLHRNYQYLEQFFQLFGLKYYVRISRLGKQQYDNPFDFGDIFPVPHPILKEDKIHPNQLYNYFIFKLK